MWPERNIDARWCALVATVLAALVTVVGGAFTPGYSHVAQYISELGVRGTTVGALVSYAGFLPVGLAALAALVLGLRGRAIDPSLRSSAIWMLTLPLAYITAAFARCTQHCAGVDAAQALHNLAGLGEYLGGALALFVAGVASFRNAHAARGFWLLILGVIMLGCLAGIFSVSMAGLHGAIQRVAETILFGFLVFLVWEPAWRGVSPVRSPRA